MLRFSLLGLLGVVLFAAIGCAALVSAIRTPGSEGSIWWASSVASLTLLAFGVCLFQVIFRQGKTRAAATGAVVAAAGYWLLALSPWLGPSMGPRLITTRMIAVAERKLMKQDDQQQQLLQPNVIRVWDAPTGASTLTVAGTSVWTSYPPLSAFAPTTVPHGSTFADVAHHLLMWPLALLGALLAGLLYARSRPAALPVRSAAVG